MTPQDKQSQKAAHTSNAPLGFTDHEKSAWSVGYQEGAEGGHAAQILKAIALALERGHAASDILDENSPIRDQIRAALSQGTRQAEPVALSPTHERAAPAPEDFSDADADILKSAYAEFETFHARRNGNPDRRAVKRPLTEGSLIDGLTDIFSMFEQYEDFWLHWKESPGVRQHVRAALSGSAESKKGE